MAPTSFLAPRSIRWPVLLVGALATLTLGLSAHVVMMTVLHVPFPAGSPKGGVLMFLNNTAIVLAALLIYQLGDFDRFARPAPVKALLVFLLVTTMTERLLRVPLMNGFVTTAWAYAFIENVPKLAPWAVLAALVVAIGSRASSWPRRLMASLAITALAYLVVAPLVRWMYAPVLAAAAPLQHDAVYGFPYGWEVTTAAYVTYVEPVAACLAGTAIVWPRLPGGVACKIAAVALLIVMLRGSLLSPFAYAAAHADHAVAAFVSDGQYAFESLVLGVLAGATWAASTWRRAETAPAAQLR